MAEKTTDPIEIDTKGIKELMEFYGFQDNLVYDPYAEFDEVEPKAAYASEIFRYFINHYLVSKRIDPIELLSLIKFLKSCNSNGKGNPLILKRKITTSSKYGLKGQEKTITISNNRILNALELFINTLMYDNLTYYEKTKFSLEKKPLDNESLDFIIGVETDSNLCFYEPLTDDEIDRLSTMQTGKLTKNCLLGLDAEYFLALLKLCNIQGNKTKLYSFVYDLMRLAKHTGKKCITEEGFSGDVGREKYQQVKNWCQACSKEFTPLPIKRPLDYTDPKNQKLKVISYTEEAVRIVKELLWLQKQCLKQ